jgi:hypothetical protein
LHAEHAGGALGPEFAKDGFCRRLSQSFMEFIAGGMHSATQLKAAVKQGCGLAFGARVGFVFADQHFNLMSQQTADRSRTVGGEDLGFLNGLAVETKALD